MIARLFTAALLLAFSAVPVLAWGCDQHHRLAIITRAHLTPRAEKAVDDLLRAHPIDPALRRFCRDRPTDPMADSADWADDVRQKLDDPWHFIDIPLNILKPVPNLTPWCSPLDLSVRGGQASGCVISALDLNRKILEDHSRLVKDRADALRFVIHFFGDITQPLHNVSDTGGNCISVMLKGQTRPTNIHSLWDSGILAYVRAQRRISSEAYFKDLDARFAIQSKQWMREKPNAVKWSWESHRLGVEVAYGALSPRVPNDLTDMPAGCEAEQAKTAALNIQVGDEYVNRVLPVMEQQMLKAAYRLAGYLNSALGR